MIMRFKAYSLKNSDSSYVYREGRERGCKKGEINLVFGQDIKDSEYRLDIIRTAFYDNGVKFLSNRKASFTIEIL